MVKRSAVVTAVGFSRTKNDDRMYQVKWNGRKCTPVFNSRGAAEAYLDMLASGRRKPEYGKES